MKVLGIHGIGNLREGKEPEIASQMSALWAQYLTEGGTPGSDVRVTYYADLLQEEGHQGEDGRLEDLSDAESQFLADVFDQQELPEPVGVAQGWLTFLLRTQMQDIVASKACSPGVMEWFMVRWAREVCLYLQPSAAREAVQKRVREAIAAHQPDVVIAHSLGSVIAYEVLHNCRDIQVPLLVTLGSPLALPKTVFPRLTPSPGHGRGKKPQAVHRWANLADPGDLVAVPVKGISRRFDGVESDQHCSVHQTYRFHHVEQYLKTPKLARLLASVPTSDEQPA
ncbi:serine peptidase [Streptomyces europaeiscabiei]|uniref:serine peptidase n=1 Tax=Streptomyces europaeiscabiei TaxID=146819 RepID=UPI0029A80817|nr:serine peptidase [Streptomyces europaeiscabiei]MDX3847866.1 serine peptidase [Streptomyces europaeiscabiei]